MPPDLHLLPTFSTIRATKQSHTGCQKNRSWPCCADTQGMRVHHTLNVCFAGNFTFEMLLVSENEQILGAVIPCVTSIETANDAADFNTRIKFVGGTGIGCEPNNTTGK